MQNDRSNPSTVPFSQAYWAVPGRLMAGCYPGSEDRDEARQKLGGLIACGIRHVINLMEPHERNRYGRLFVPYEDDLRSIAREMGLVVTIQRTPIKDMHAPSYAEMQRILDRIDECIAEGRSVYIHCLGGRGRTGTVVGCYLARHSAAAGQEALGMVRQLRMGTGDSQAPSPEMPAQITMVRSWREGE